MPKRNVLLTCTYLSPPKSETVDGRDIGLAIEEHVRRKRIVNVLFREANMMTMMIMRGPSAGTSVSQELETVEIIDYQI